jgi:Concanavalin A-like lectin/glucanases superfamily
MLLLSCCLLAAYTNAQAQSGGAGYALRFHGNGVNDIDRIKIAIDDPTTSDSGPPADVGARRFTLEFWMKAFASENQAPAVQCGDDINWIYGNIVFDRDRFSQDRKFGLSIAGGQLVFGVSGNGTGNRTICGRTNVLDGQWHHVAIQRRRVDGMMWLYVDGNLEAKANGPKGDISYPDDGIPGDYCGGPCTNSDPYLVIGAEKHDAGSQYPSFSGWIDEVRLSTTIRYHANFTRPSAPFPTDPQTVALYHFDEGDGDLVQDTSGAPGGPSHGVRRFGGNPPGPEWVLSDAPLMAGPPPLPPPPAQPQTLAIPSQ